MAAGFPTEKAKEYVKLRQPYSLNSLEMEDVLRDRRRIYDLLEEHRIPIPEKVYANRDGYKDSDPNDLMIVEADDFIQVNNTTIHKPFVEKPVDAEDHSVYIYYPMSAGGGSKRLFRKVGDRSSEFYPKVNHIRREGSYIYEAFVETQGTDVKVYTVGPDYGHAEARKSPTLDGKVNRDPEGKEIRYPVILSQEEIAYARKVTLAFKQCVCGFDLLRVQGKSYVCDVNGWSFVKNSRKYFEDCAALLQGFIEAAVKPATLSLGDQLHKAQLISWRQHGVHRGDPSCARDFGAGMSTQSTSPALSPPLTPSRREQIPLKQHQHQELRCVIAIIRHGDRTPKQKMKMKTSLQPYLDFYHKFSPGPRKDLKIKGKNELKEFLATTVDLVQSLDPAGVGEDMYQKLNQIKQVLERWEISGINRKLQLKPQQWTDFSVEAQDQKGGGECAGRVGEPVTQLVRSRSSMEKCTSLLLILKWGGELTKLGEQQAIELGASFRRIMYPDAGGGGLLRLHSTFRHDLKIKTSDEGRVMKTAASFAKGFLELEGELPPILVSLVHKVNNNASSVTMLDRSGNKDIKKDLNRSKEFLSHTLGLDANLSREHIKTIVPAGQESVRSALHWLGNPVAKLRHLLDLMESLVKQVSFIVTTSPLGAVRERIAAEDKDGGGGIEGVAEIITSWVEEDKDFRGESWMPAQGETPLLMLHRWQKLHKELYDPSSGFDVTKIPDVHDNVRYDCLHNAHMRLKGLPELYDLAKHLADCVVPQEYGVTIRDKLIIGSKMCSALLEKIKYDLIIARSNNEVDMRFRLDVRHMDDLPINSLARRVRTRLYFTSESHMHTLLNVLRFPIGDHPSVLADEAKRMLSRTKELCYLTSFVIRLFEDMEKESTDPARFRVEILFSPGVVKHSLLPGDHLHTAPLVPLQKNLPCAELEATLDAAIALGAKEHLGEVAVEHEAELLKRQLADQMRDSSEPTGGESPVSPASYSRGHARERSFWVGVLVGTVIGLVTTVAWAAGTRRRHL